ncbi:PP2C family serine/threonine-protein phosphatase [Actinotalea sp. Marseille-Q4924]|uniref:PP2C family protein-serine/threonine phosphatase n=1 Tax=Actinotalea sp. Marseille-Q4924 TaxID=2866571 RepID=UPI001CE4AF0E|nr:protein phosphatase 2C domain-containing protein [Actinotalea sp. Marseille-Q4924]
MRTSWGSATDRGRVRALNEDSLLAYPPVFLVADGMGGHEAGDIASRLAVEEFSQLLGHGTATVEDVHACFHRTAERLAETVGGGRVAGTTVAGVVVAELDGGAYWLVFNIGDSRVYRLAAGELEQISVDHSVVQDLVDAGDLSPAEAAVHPERHVITRAVGGGLPPEPDYWLIPAGPTDRLLICSDGLTSELTDAVLRSILLEREDPQQAAHELVRAALSAGGKDNVSAVVVDVARAQRTADVESTADAGHVRTAAPDADGATTWDDAVDGDTVPRPTGPAGTRTPEVLA